MGYYDDERDFMILHVSLRIFVPWYKRIWIAFKYILGIRNRWNYDEMILLPEDIESLKGFLEEFLEEPSDGK
jgi:hypothetical protein